MRTGIIVFPGSNCDRDCKKASDLMGWTADFLWHNERKNLSSYDLIILPGGFSYGDYLRPGAISSLAPIMEDVKEFAQKGGRVLGICNGFQVLLECGLLPGALLPNPSLRFICRNLQVRVENINNHFTGGFQKDRVLNLPVAHGDGRFFCSPDQLQKLERENRIVFKYCNPEGKILAPANPNGSTGAIAGIINEEGNVLGMMPHPERAMEKILSGRSEDGRLLFASLEEVQGI